MEEKSSPSARRAILALAALCALGATAASTGATPQHDAIAVPPLRSTLPGLIRQGTLDPHLPGDVKQLKFSPDGKFILAQDDARIFVLSRQPLSVLFHIDAPAAEPAQFTPDSSEIVFLTGGPHPAVNRWEVADGKPGMNHDVQIANCIETRLSPDGNRVACFSRQATKSLFASAAAIDLAVFDMATGNTVVEKKSFLPGDFLATPAVADLAAITQKLAEAGIDSPFPMIPAAFSPDGHYFLAGTADQIVAFDLDTGAPFPLEGSFVHMTAMQLFFVSPTRVLVLNSGDFSDKQYCTSVEFPTGLVTKQIEVDQQVVAPATDGDYFFLRPGQTAAVGVRNWKSDAPIGSLHQDSSVDIYGQYLVAQTNEGQIALYQFPGGQLDATVDLPFRPGDRLEASAVSPTLEWLALSLRTRGAVWNLAAPAAAYHLSSFQGGYFDGNSSFYAEAARLGSGQNAVDRLDLSTGKGSSAVPIDVKLARPDMRGRFLLSMSHSVTPKGDDDFLFQVQDAHDGRLLWARGFPKEKPARIEISPAENRLIFRWDLTQKSVGEEIKKDKALKARFDKIQRRSLGSLVEVVEADSGRAAGTVLIDPPQPRKSDTNDPSTAPSYLPSGGNWTMTQQPQQAQSPTSIFLSFSDPKPKPAPVSESSSPKAFASGDSLFFTLNDGQTQLYSLASGNLKATVYGFAVTASVPAGLFATLPQTAQANTALQLYALSSAKPAAKLSFPSPVILAHFSADGGRLLVVTQDQQFFLFDSSALSQPNTPLAAEANP